MLTVTDNPRTIDEPAPPGPDGKATAARLRGVVHEYGRHPNNLVVLHGIDLDISAGRLTLIMGPSGSGKTTLLTILGLLRRPTEGHVEIAGHQLSALRETELTSFRRRHVSFIFQGFNLLAALTALENVQLALELQGVPDGRTSAEALGLLDRVGLKDRAHHRPSELSCGQQQRVAIARSLASPARLVLADEPTASLDSTSARVIMELLRRQADEEGRAVVVVTHDPRLEQLADNIVHMEDGRVAETPGR